MPSKKKIAQAAFIVFLLNVVSKFSGFFRNFVIAMFFGASSSTDANGIANALTATVTVLSGPISTAFLPILSSHLAKGDEEGARRVSSSVVTISAILVLTISLVASFFAPSLVRLVGSGLNESGLRDAVMLTRVYFPAMLLPLLAAYAKLALNAYGEFNIPAASVTIQNLVTIATIALLAPVLGVKALALGFLLSNAAAFLVQVPPWLKKGAFPKLSLRVDESTRQVFMLSLPLIASSIFAQIYVLVDRNLASRLAEGSVAILTYADTLRQIPMGLFVAAVTTVIYPSLSSMWAKGDKESFRDTVIMGLRYVEFICVPAAVGLITLARPIVRLAYERMAFTPQATLATAGVVMAYAPALIGMAAGSVNAFAFYSAHETLTPVLLGIGTSLFNTGLDVILVRAMGLPGLALANSLASIAGTMVGLYLLNRFIGGLPVKGLGMSLGKILLASAVMGASAFELGSLTGLNVGTGSFMRDVLAAGATVGGAGIVFLGVAAVLRCEELSTFLGLVKDKLRP